MEKPQRWFYYMFEGCIHDVKLIQQQKQANKKKIKA